MMKRRGKLPAGIFYPKGTEILYVRFTNEFGKQIAESTKFNNIDIAKALLERRRREVIARKSPVAAAILNELTVEPKTYRKFLDEDYYPSVENEPSYQVRKYTLEAFAKNYGDLLVRDIKVSHLLQYRNKQRFVTKKLDSHGNPITAIPANGTKNRHRAWILSSLSYAVSVGQYHENQLKGIHADVNYPNLPEEERPPRAFSVKQLHDILDAAEIIDNDLYQIIRFAIATGIRLGQIRSFRWDYVNFNNNEIKSPPKNPKSKKWLVQPISEPVRTVLEERLTCRQKNVPYVFFNPKTGTKWVSKYRRWWHILEVAKIRNRTDKKTMEKLERENLKRLEQGLETLPIPEQIELGIETVFHSLRHSFGSHLNDMHIPVATCSKLLGHTSIEMTQRYLTSLRSVQEDKSGLDLLGKLVNHHPQEPHPLSDEFIDEDIREVDDEEGFENAS